MKALNGILAVVQINAVFLGTNLENLRIPLMGVAAPRPRETFGIGFAGR